MKSNDFQIIKIIASAPPSGKRANHFFKLASNCSREMDQFSEGLGQYSS
jgi:hypothetical protein